MARQAVILHQPAAPFCGSCSMPCIHVRFLFWYIALQHRQHIAEGFFPGGYMVRRAPGATLLFGDLHRHEAMRSRVLLQLAGTLLRTAPGCFSQRLSVQVDDGRESVPVPLNRDEGVAFAIPAEKRVACRICHYLAVVFLVGDLPGTADSRLELGAQVTVFLLSDPMLGSGLFEILQTVILPGRWDLPLPGHLNFCPYIFQQTLPHGLAHRIVHSKINTYRVVSTLAVESLYHVTADNQSAGCGVLYKGTRFRMGLQAKGQV